MNVDKISVVKTFCENILLDSFSNKTLLIEKKNCDKELFSVFPFTYLHNQLDEIIYFKWHFLPEYFQFTPILPKFIWKMFICSVKLHKYANNSINFLKNIFKTIIFLFLSQKTFKTTKKKSFEVKILSLWILLSLSVEGILVSELISFTTNGQKNNVI